MTGREQPPAGLALADIMHAVGQGHGGDRAGARSRLEHLWSQLGDDGDAAYRCILAHYLADLQDTVEAELAWDERAMAAVADLTDERLRAVHPALTVAGFLPSLHLKLADDHRRLGDGRRARAHLEAAARLAGELPDDDYGRHLRAGVEHVSGALDSGSTDRLPTHP